MKRKNLTPPGIDGIQDYLWKRFVPAQDALKRAFDKIEVENEILPAW